MLATEGGYVEIVKMLLDAGANPNLPHKVSVLSSDECSFFLSFLQCERVCTSAPFCYVKRGF